MELVLVMLLAVASAFDAGTHRIPNALVVGIAASGLLAQALAGGLPGAGTGVSALAIVALALWPAWTRRWLGGADLKLGAAAAVWVGVARVLDYLLLSAVGVGVVSLACYALSARTARAEVRRNLAIAVRGIPIVAPIQAEKGRVQVPAGIGFALGALAVLAGVGGL